jgi:hypothetical protein
MLEIRFAIGDKVTLKDEDGNWVDGKVFMIPAPNRMIEVSVGDSPVIKTLYFQDYNKEWYFG